MSTISVREVRVHFGEALRQVRDHEIITVEHGGKPEAVILFVEEYEQLKQHAPRREQ
jgi:prevent-host-death family protein